MSTGRRAAVGTPSLPRWAAPAAVLVVVAVQPALDHLDPETQFLLFGLVDWIGHLATGVVLVALLQPKLRVALAILVGSVLIDLDHVPLELGTDVLTGDATRPYTHSLLTLLVVLTVAAVARSEVVLGLAIGLAGHFARDLGGGDVLLLWPLSTEQESVPFAVYVAVLALTAATAAARPTARRTPAR
jgi:inner membrane protein